MASLSEPHSSELSHTSIMFTNSYKNVHIHCAFANVYALKRIENQIPYKCFALSGHHTMNYNISLLELHIRLGHTFISQKITAIYCGTTLKLLALATELSGLVGGAKAIEEMEKITIS